MQKIVRESTAALPDSDVRLLGTIAGRPFEARMQRGESGRVRLRFVGFRFATEQEVDAFLSPFAGPRFREAELTGEAAGRPVTRRREPAAE